MKRVIGNIIFILYAVIAVFVTICLLSYNDYKISEFGNNSLIIIDSNEVEPDFMKGDLVIANKEDQIDVNDKVFFYNTYENQMEVTLGTVTNEEVVTSTESTYTINGEIRISSEYVIGPADSAIRIGGVGTVLGILESQWGFLFLIVLPSLIAFLYEIYVVVSEIRGKKQEEAKEAKG